MKFAKMLLAAAVFFAAAGFPAFARCQQAEQQSNQQSASPDPSAESSAQAPDQPTPSQVQPPDGGMVLGARQQRPPVGRPGHGV